MFLRRARLDQWERKKFGRQCETRFKGRFSDVTSCFQVRKSRVCLCSLCGKKIQEDFILGSMANSASKTTTHGPVVFFSLESWCSPSWLKNLLGYCTSISTSLHLNSHSVNEWMQTPSWGPQRVYFWKWPAFTFDAVSTYETTEQTAGKLFELTMWLTCSRLFNYTYFLI